MLPRPIRTRDDLLRALLPYCPTRSCEQALQDGRALVLGGFTPAGGLSCWIVKVMAKHGQEWYLGLECDDTAHQYRPKLFTPATIPWADWDGKPPWNRPLIDGDCPLQSREHAAQHTNG